MNSTSPVSKTMIIMSSCFSLVIVCFLTIFSHHSKPYLIFCNVEQADASIIETDNRNLILIDTGKDNKVIDCLGRYTPFYKKTIKLIVITDTKKEHLGGLPNLLKSYTIERIVFQSIPANDRGLQKNLDLLHIPYIQASKKLIFNIDSTYIALYPKNKVLISTVTNKYGRIIFTGHATAKDLYEFTVEREADIITVPHHGSANGLTLSFLQLAKPRYAVISLSNKNRFNYPSDEIMTILRRNNVEILRTDQVGDIVFKGGVKS